jgi:hypothetical protein
MERIAMRALERCWRSSGLPRPVSRSPERRHAPPITHDNYASRYQSEPPNEHAGHRPDRRGGAPSGRAALEGAADLARAEKAEATKRAYGSDFAIFRAWCAEQGLCALPGEPAAVAAFIAAETARGIKCATLGRRIAGIRHAHKLAGLTSPTDDERVKAVIRGARRTLGVAPVKKSAATSDKVLAMVAGGGRGLIGKRDLAGWLLGWIVKGFRTTE